MIDLNLITDELEPYLKKDKVIKAPRKGGLGKIFAIVTVFLILAVAVAGFFLGKDYVMEMLNSDENPFFVGSSDTLSLPNPDELLKEEDLAKRQDPDLTKKEKRADFVETEIPQPDFEKEIEEKKLVPVQKDRAVSQKRTPPVQKAESPSAKQTHSESVPIENYIASENSIPSRLLLLASKKADELTFKSINITNPVSMSVVFENGAHAKIFELFLEQNGINSQSRMHRGNYQIHAITGYRDGGSIYLEDVLRSDEIIKSVENAISSHNGQIADLSQVQQTGEHKRIKIVVTGSQVTVDAAAKMVNEITSVYDAAGISQVAISRRGNLYDIRMDISLYFK